jgi:hypothetical protein
MDTLRKERLLSQLVQMTNVSTLTGPLRTKLTLFKSKVIDYMSSSKVFRKQESYPVSIIKVGLNIK